MNATKMANDDLVEAAVLKRARRNFLDNGPSDRMWSDPSPVQESTMSAGFILSDDQRAAYIAAAQAEVASERNTAERPEEFLLGSGVPRTRLCILALYESYSKAQVATATLVAAGIPERAINVVVAPVVPDESRAEAGISTS